jgi:hypothetical protein
MLRVLTLRVVLAAGAATRSVVVAVVGWIMPVPVPEGVSELDPAST